MYFCLLSDKRRITMDGDIENVIKIPNTFHHFRAFSELSGKDSKGGYIQAKISVPSNASKITISCSTLANTPHVNFLFVSPKQRIVKCGKEKIPPQDLHGFKASQDNKVILQKNHQGKFEICPPNYWDGLTSSQILGCDFWNGQEELVLGPNALQLTVCKALQKVCGISRDDLGSEGFDGQMEKIRLKVEFELVKEQNVVVKYLNSSAELLPVDDQNSKVTYSSVLFDKVNLTNFFSECLDTHISFLFSKNIALKSEKSSLVEKFAITMATISY